MQPDQAEVKDLAQLTREMNPKQLRNSLKRAYRAEAKKVLGIARKSLHATVINRIGIREYAATFIAGVVAF